LKQKPGSKNDETSGVIGNFVINPKVETRTHLKKRGIAEKPNE